MRIECKYVKIEFDDKPPVYGIITKLIHPQGPAWPELYEVNVGTEQNPKFEDHYEYGNGYEMLPMTKEDWMQQKNHARQD